MSIVVSKCVVNVSAYVYTSHYAVSVYQLYLKFKKQNNQLYFHLCIYSMITIHCYQVIIIHCYLKQT